MVAAGQQNPSPYPVHSFSIDGKRLCYVDEGHGQVLLCLHGNPTWSYFYRQVVATFRDRWRVVVPDHMGCGLSDRPQAYPYTLAQHITNLAALIAHLGLADQPLTLLVHDWGGAIGLGWAVRAPERVRGVMVMNSAAFYSRDVPKRIELCRLPWLGEWLLRRVNVFARAALWMASQRGLDRPTRQAYLYPYDSYRSRIGIARFVQDIPTTPEHPSYQTLQAVEAGLGALSCPVQFIWGARDFCFHLGFLQRWQELFPQAHTQLFTHAGHYLLEDEPQGVLQVIARFLRYEHRS